MRVTSTFLNRKRAQQFKALRAGLIGQLYPTMPISTVGTNDDNQQITLLSDLVGSFKRFASNQQTTFDNRAANEPVIYDVTAGQSSAITIANAKSSKVDAAIAQAYRKAPGKISTNVVEALDAAFSKPSNGQLATLPVTSQSTSLNLREGKALEELSTRQQGLYRQVSWVAMDALRLLNELHTFVPEADKERFLALQSLVESQIRSFVEEVGRPDEPRAARAISLLRSLQESIVELGDQGAFNDPTLAAILDDDEQIARFDVLKNYIKLMANSWSEYYANERSGRSYSISERADRARVLLPILSQANRDFGNALESVGVSESERRSRAYRFTTLQSPVITLQVTGESTDGGSVCRRAETIEQTSENDIAAWLSDITVSDLQDWLYRFSDLEAPNALTSVYGIDFVTDQSDRLFWIIAPVVAYLRTTKALNPAGQSALGQILSHERVGLALDNLLSQLNALADLAV
jgi:hypothetical protein